MRPRLIAIVGGSGSGKTWLAERLQQLLGAQAVRVSLDDFYRDRSHLSPARRARLNFDHPRAIDWLQLQAALRRLAQRRPAKVPDYDFATHCRKPRPKLIRPKPIVLVDGLWLLRRPTLRRLFYFSIFLDCSRTTRLRRRLARDRLTRSRDRAGILRQFRTTVDPMHRRFVAPQARWANLVISGPCRQQHLRQILPRLRQPLAPNTVKTYWTEPG